MQLPTIAPGKRFTLPRPVGSADALLLARLAREHADARRVLAIFTAEPSDTTRLADELPFFEPTLRVAVFPDWETLPYDTFSPHQDLISERLATLWRVRSGEVDVVLLPATTALTRLAPPSFMAGTTFQFKQKTRLDEAGLKAQLTLAGYQHVSQVVSPGEYAVRGGLIDLFPMGSPVPYRVDLFGDEVDSIRTFDPDSQRSLYPVPEVRLLPGREFPLDEAARTAFRARWREKLEGDPTKARLYKDMGAGHCQWRHRVLPAAVLRTDRHHLRLPRRRRRRWCCTATVDAAFEHFWTDTRERHRFLQHDPERPILPPAEHLHAGRGVLHAHAAACRAARCAATKPQEWARPLPDVSIDRGATEPLGLLERHIRQTPHRVLLLAESDGRRESLLELLRDHRIDVPSVDTLAEFLAGDEKVAIAVGAAGRGLPLASSRTSGHLGRSSSPRPNSSPPRRRRGAAASRSRSAASRR